MGDKAGMEVEKIRPDHKIILDIIERNSYVLDLGCGDGELLFLLQEKKDVKGQGTDIKEEAIYRCVARGLSVFHSDIETGLFDYPDKSFDYVMLNQSLQEARNSEKIIFEALRVGKKVIVGFPNFAYIRARFQLFFKGIAPVTASLPYTWYNTPNIHFLSIKDFINFCKERDIDIREKYFLWRDKKIFLFPNLLAHIGIFVLEKHTRSSQ